MFTETGKCHRCGEHKRIERVTLGIYWRNLCSHCAQHFADAITDDTPHWRV